MKNYNEFKDSSRKERNSLKLKLNELAKKAKDEVIIVNMIEI